ncbi:TetR/AcrR family transcriptional regulator [Terrisporobacter petrolearius]|uniref:TetR/AcrR family transcriptional regulator n=1 Tax=Terrisporobacter petrolearius TaxID=1460447 RepID=UPI001D160C65|nr:TetR/AcrR family transcriptional regulator [Terrisporobacter petrolearius]MCC3863746.1 TetR/AcrR family transcriptional regulator [Terrisporobacter petrolearius]
MARIVKQEEYNAKRNEILNVAQNFVYTKGYEQMTIQDILTELGISKGTFFHYFTSKQAMLEALVERFMDQGEEQITPIVKDEDLSAIEKLNNYFAVAGKWKVGQKDYLISLMRVWYSDDNAIIRQKMLTYSTKRISPLLSAIILQGLHEGKFKPSFPDYAGEVVLSLIQSVWDRLSMMILTDEHDGNSIDQMRIMLAAYTDSIEKVLGIPESTLRLIDDETMKHWFNIN